MKFKDIYDKEPEIHTESIEVHQEGIIDNIVDWIKGEKLVAISRYKYLNQFCKVFEDEKVNKGTWKFFMPPSENYVSKLAMYAFGRTAGQVMNGYIKNIHKAMKPKKESTEDSVNEYYPQHQEDDNKEQLVMPEDVLRDFEDFAATIDRNAAVMDMQPVPVELEKCDYIVKVLHKLQGIKKQDWLEPIEEAKEDMKNDPKFFDFKEQLKPLEQLAQKMEEFRYKWSKFILDNVKFEEVKTRGDDAGSRKEVSKPTSDEPRKPTTNESSDDFTPTHIPNSESYNTISLFKDLGRFNTSIKPEKKTSVNVEGFYDKAQEFFIRLGNKIFYKDIELRIYSKTYQPNEAIQTIWHYGISDKQKNFPDPHSKEQDQYYKEKIIDYCNKKFKLPTGTEEYVKYILDYSGKNLQDAIDLKCSTYEFNGNMRRAIFILEFVLNGKGNKLLIDFIKKNFTAGWYDKDGKLLKKII